MYAKLSQYAVLYKIMFHTKYTGMYDGTSSIRKCHHRLDKQWPYITLFAHSYTSTGQYASFLLVKY